MNILLLAPHPFYQDRGTPIAVHLLLGALSAQGHSVDVLTYHEGDNRTYPNVRVFRIPRLPGIRNIPPGFSFKKLMCDAVMLRMALRMARQNRYQVVHAVEESVFIALMIRRLYHTPYVFDMDSSMPQQLVEKHFWLKILSPWFHQCESSAVRKALAVVPVCDALADIARRHDPKALFILRDVSLLPENPGETKEPELDLPATPGTRFMYIGNLEAYQGIDLLLDSFAALLRKTDKAGLVIVGGTPAHIRHYQAKAAQLHIQPQVHFTGHCPIPMMAALFQKADVLVSPRIKGNNTPMKIYSYLQSGKPILATNLPTHTQVLTPEMAVLAAPDPDSFAEAMRQLIEHPESGKALAQRARTHAESRYSMACFNQTVKSLYTYIEQQFSSIP